jgi:FkbM family methyltransferase
MDQIIEFNYLKVGHRVKMKGKVGENGVFVAQEISLEAPADQAVIEGLIQGINLPKNTLRLLNHEFAVPNGIEIKDLQRNIIGLKDLKVGDRMKLKGKYLEHKGFVPEKIKMQETTNFNLGELQGEINKIDLEKKTLEVVGFKVVVDGDSTHLKVGPRESGPLGYFYSSMLEETREKIDNMPLIMDIGMNNGRDSFFYLRKGFRVVAVEGNPFLVEKVSKRLAAYIASGQLIIEPVGLGQKEGQIPFYINLDDDGWSSFNKALGTRNGTRYKELSVACIQPQSLFQKYGMPYYLKIDIEGSDIEVVRALHDFSDRPRYISMEDNQTRCFFELWSVGCRAFKIVNQAQLGKIRCPNPPLEGRYVDVKFDGTTSGPFGDEAPGEWMTLDRALEKYLTEIRSPTRGFLAENSWFDIHGRIE